MDMPDKPEGKPLTEQELQFCNLYVNGGLEYAGQPFRGSVWGECGKES